MLLALLPTETMADTLLAVMCALNDKLDNMLREGGRVKRVSNQGACLCCTPGRALMEMWAGDSARMEPHCAFAPVAALACRPWHMRRPPSACGHTNTRGGLVLQPGAFCHLLVAHTTTGDRTLRSMDHFAWDL